MTYFSLGQGIKVINKDEKLELNIDITQLNPDGKPPVARILHSAVHFKERYLSKAYKIIIYSYFWRKEWLCVSADKEPGTKWYLPVWYSK